MKIPHVMLIICSFLKEGEQLAYSGLSDLW